MENRSLHMSKVLVLTMLLASTQALAGEVMPLQNGGAEWRAGVDGIVIEWNDAGEVNRIYSQYAQPVSIPDTRGIRTAKTIAEEKAKGLIVRFLEQEVSDERFVKEITADMESASAHFSNGEAPSISSSAQREVVSSLTELTSSMARGTLRGVIRLEEGYDEKSRETWVKVGISQKTMRAAGAVRNAIANDGQVNDERASSESDSENSNLPRSHVRKTEQKDW